MGWGRGRGWCHSPVASDPDRNTINFIFIIRWFEAAVALLLISPLCVFFSHSLTYFILSFIIYDPAAVSRTLNIHSKMSASPPGSRRAHDLAASPTLPFTFSLLRPRLSSRPWRWRRRGLSHPPPCRKTA